MDKNAKMWNFGEKLDLVALSKQFIVILNKVAQFWNLNLDTLVFLQRKNFEFEIGIEIGIIWQT